MGSLCLCFNKALPQFHSFFKTNLFVYLMQHPHVAKGIHKDGVGDTEIRKFCDGLHLRAALIYGFLEGVGNTGNHNIEPK